jgi:hypothetical protein
MRGSISESTSQLPSSASRWYHNFCRRTADRMNKLYYGDNLQVLRDSVAAESVDLVYLDPPFNSQANYNVLFKAPTGQKSEAQITLAELTKPMLTEAVKTGYFETPYGKYPKVQILTIAELFAGAKPNIPLIDPTAFKKSAKELTTKQHDLF